MTERLGFYRKTRRRLVLYDIHRIAKVLGGSDAALDEMARVCYEAGDQVLLRGREAVVLGPMHHTGPGQAEQDIVFYPFSAP